MIGSTCLGYNSAALLVGPASIFFLLRLERLAPRIIFNHQFGTSSVLAAHYETLSDARKASPQLIGLSSGALRD